MMSYPWILDTSQNQSEYYGGGNCTDLYRTDWSLKGR